MVTLDCLCSWGSNDHWNPGIKVATVDPEPNENISFLECLWETLQKCSDSLLEKSSPGQISYLIYPEIRRKLQNYRWLLLYIAGPSAIHKFCFLQPESRGGSGNTKSPKWGEQGCEDSHSDQPAPLLGEINWQMLCQIGHRRETTHVCPLRPLALSVTRRHWRADCSRRLMELSRSQMLSLEWENLWLQLASDHLH